MGTKDYMDLIELQSRIKEGVAEAFPGKYWVKAEISSWSPRSNGHCYLTLTQSLGGKAIAESRAMIWKWHFPQLKAFFEKTTGQPLQAGITVLVRVQVSFSELYGISLFIDNIDPAFTLGEKALERKRAIEKLTSGGYMDMQKELALPELPFRLAVISSETAAGYGDFRNHLLNNPQGYAFKLDLYPAMMQGEQAPASIVAAILSASEKAYDAILILRGGGSELDLECYDDFGLAVSIATCPVPVVTAIGHDKDLHIADMVAHTYVKTPTALADLFLDAFLVQDDALDRFEQRIGTAVLRLMGREELRLKTADAAIQRSVQRRLGEMTQRISALHASIRLGLGRLLHQEAQRQTGIGAAIRLGLSRKYSEQVGSLQHAEGRIAKGLTGKYSQLSRQGDAIAHRIRFAASARVGQEVSTLALKEARIKSTDPRNILSLGYVLVTGKDNKVLKTVEKVSVGDRIGVRFGDGSLTARVDQVFSEEKDNVKTHIA